MKENSDLILELPGFVPESFCKHLIEKFENDEDKRDGVIIHGERHIVNKELKNSIELELTSPKWSLEDTKISEYVQSVCELYTSILTNEYNYEQPMHAFAPLLSVVKKFGVYDVGYAIQKQKKGAEYKWHYDQDASIADSYIFGILYLNTLEPDEGGCTEFINGRKIRPECGKIMLCPANWTYAHCGNEVKSESKYILTFMIYFNSATTSKFKAS
jgi:hypothetical protein